MPSQNFRVKNGLEVGTGVTISATGIISATSIQVSGNSASTFPQLIVSGITTFQSNVYLGDNDILNFGDDNDLRIYYDGTNNVINGTQNIYIGAAFKDIFLRTGNNGTIDGIRVRDQAAVELYHNGTKKFETTGAGATVLGTLQSQQLNISGISTLGNTVVGGTLQSQQLNISGISTLGNTVVGGATTQLIVNGNTRITGILTIGQSSVTLDGNNNQINVGAGVTIHHTNGVQVGGNTVHSTGLTVNQINVSGISTLSNVSEKINNLGNTGTSATINLNNGNFVTATLNESCTFTFTNPASEASSFTLLLTNDGTSGRTITWPASVVWPGGTIPTRTTTANKTDVYVFFTVNSGTKWYGNLAQYNYA